jgi:hypothetical protein
MRHVCSGQTAHEFAYTQTLLCNYLTANVTLRFGEEIRLIDQLDEYLRCRRSVLNGNQTPGVKVAQMVNTLLRMVL